MTSFSTVKSSHMPPNLIADFLASMARWRLWTSLAWEDIRQRYRRTLLGVLWASLAFALFCGVKVFIFGSLSRSNASFFTAYVVLGYLVWQYVAAIVSDGCVVFVSAAGWIKGSRIPLPMFVLQSIARLSILTSFSSIAAVFFLVYAGNPINAVAFASLAAIPAYLLTAFPIQIMVGLLCAFMRDLQQIVVTLMRVLFFLTPIVWIPAQLGVHGRVAIYNPFTHYLEIFRSPILYGEIPWFSWAIVSAAIVAAWVIAYLMYRYLSGKIAFVI